MITPDLQSVSIFVRPGVTDMRKQANGLSLVVEESMSENPGSGSLYFFVIERRNFLNAYGGIETVSGFSKNDWRKDVSPGRTRMKRPGSSVQINY